MRHRVDLLEVLRQAERRISPEDRLIQDVNEILDKDYRRELNLKKAVEIGQGEPTDSAGLQQERIFSKDAIREVAIRYRLRFLESDLFKADIPAEAFSEMRRFADTTGNHAPMCKILAPAKKFRLNDGDTDPMLFAQLSDGSYYLIHKWGKDFSAVRRLVALPFSSFPAVLITILTLTFLLALSVPTSWVNTSPNVEFWNSYRVALIPWMFLIISAAGAFAWFTFNWNLSRDAWQSTDEKL